MADDQQWRALTRVAELQGAAISTGMEAEQRFLASDPEADQAYERYFDRARRYLSGVLDYNTHCADGMPVEPVALPLVNALLRRADLVAADGHRERGVAYRRTVMRLSARHLGPVAAADVRRSQAAQLADEGRFNEALLELDRAREVFLAADDTLRAAQTALDLAQLYEWLGDFDRALHAIAAVRDRMNPYLAEGPPSDAAVLAAVRQQVAAIGRGEPSDAGVAATALQRIAYELVGHEARIRLKQGDHAAADRELRQILAHYRGLGAGEAIEYHLAVIALRRGDDTAAGQVLDRITPAFEHGLFRPRRAALHLLRSDLDRQRGAAGDAIGQADRGLAILAEHPNSDLSWRLHLRRARALAAAGRTAEALDAFLSGASVADDLRKGSLGYRLDTTFLADKLPIFTEGTLVAAERRDGVAAARLIEFVKARALTATLSIPPSARGPRGADEAAFDAVSERLDALEYLEYAGTATVDTARERATLLVRRRELAERIRIADPRWRGLSAPIEFDVDAVLARLADGDRAALTLYLLGSEIVGVLLHDGRARVARMPLTEDTRDALRRYTENLQAWQPDEFLFDLSAETGVGFEALVPAELRAAALAATTLGRSARRAAPAAVGRADGRGPAALRAHDGRHAAEPVEPDRARRPHQRAGGGGPARRSGLRRAASLPGPSGGGPGTGGSRRALPRPSAGRADAGTRRHRGRVLAAGRSRRRRSGRPPSDLSRDLGGGGAAHLGSAPDGREDRRRRGRDAAHPLSRGRPERVQHGMAPHRGRDPAPHRRRRPRPGRVVPRGRCPVRAGEHPARPGRGRVHLRRRLAPAPARRRQPARRRPSDPA